MYGTYFRKHRIYFNYLHIWVKNVTYFYEHYLVIWYENVMALVFSHENLMTLVFSHENAKIDWIWVLFRGRRSPPDLRTTEMSLARKSVCLSVCPCVCLCVCVL